MRVEVNLENILAYGLDTLTGNSRADLLAAAARAEESGKVMHVIIPDVEGGDTEIPVERNIFSHYSDLPEPDGRMHEQQSVNLTEPVPMKSGRTKIRLTQKSVDELKAIALRDGLTEEEWNYWLLRAVEIVESPYEL